MNIQPSLFAPAAEAAAPPDKECVRYEIEVRGMAIFADFTPKYWGDGIMHVAFQSKFRHMPNPISETGYYSHFSMGSCDGMTEEEIVQSIRELAESLAK